MNLQQQSENMGLMAEQSTGMRAYFGKIYNYMAGGLAVSGVTAYLGTKEPLFSLFYKVTDGIMGLTLLGWVAILAPLALIFMISSAVKQMQASRASALFWVFSALMGLSFSNIFFAYTATSIFQAFLITAASFLGLSIYGYTTKKSLASWGSFLFMGLIGVIVAMIVNIFMQSSALGFAVSIIAVFVFVGLTIYDTNRLKIMYTAAPKEAHDSLAISGALALYLDFINLFRLILMFFGNQNNK